MDSVHNGTVTETRPLFRLGPKTNAWVALIIFCIAFGLRLIGIGWGLKNDLHNQSYHPDEPIIFQYSRAIKPAEGGFVPHFYNYGTLYLSLLRISSDMVTSYTGAPDPKSSDSYWDWVSRCILAGRVLSALAGAGTAVIVFSMMRRFTGIFGAIAAGLLIAFAPAHVVHSRFQTVDIVASFLFAISVALSLQLLKSSEEPDNGPDGARVAGIREVALAGVFAGLSAGTKYSGVLAFFTLIAVLVLAKRNWLKEGLIGLVAMLASFLVTTPGFLLDHEKFVQDLAYEVQHVASGHGLAFVNTPSGFVFHGLNLVVGIGGIASVVAIAGLGWAAVKKNLWAIAVLASFVPYYLVISKAEVKFLRYTFPLYLGMASGFGWGVGELQRRGGGARLGVALGICGLGGLDFGGLRAAATLTAQMVAEDPRDVAARYIRAHAEPSSTVGFALDPWYWSVPLYPDTNMMRSVPWSVRRQQMQAAQPPIAYVQNVDGSPTAFDSKLITDLKPDFIALTSIEYGDRDRLAGAKELPPEIKPQIETSSAFFRDLNQNYKVEALFGGGEMPVEDMAYTFPTVKIWRRNGGDRG